MSLIASNDAGGAAALRGGGGMAVDPVPVEASLKRDWVSHSLLDMVEAVGRTAGIGAGMELGTAGTAGGLDLKEERRLEAEDLRRIPGRGVLAAAVSMAYWCL